MRQKLEQLIKLIAEQKAKKNPNAGPNFYDIDGKTCLHYAAIIGDFAIASKLLAAGASVEAKTLVNPEPTAIELAMQHGQLRVGKLLIKHHARCYNLKLKNITHPIARAWMREKIQEEINFEINYLGQDRSTKRLNNTFIAPLDQAGNFNAKATLRRCAEINDIDSAIFLSKKGLIPTIDFINCLTLEPNIKNGYHQDDSLVIICCSNGSLDFLKTLLAIQPQLFSLEKRYRETALQAAIASHQNHMLQFLFAQNIDINALGKNRETACHTAILNRNNDALELLLHHGAQLGEKDIHGRNEWHQAYLSGESRTIALLKRHNCPAGKLEVTDIYGKKPEEYAHTKPAIVIEHHTILLKKFYYLQLNGRTTNGLFKLEGHCNGYEFLFQLYDYDTNYFFDTLDVISAWDGSEMDLHKPFTKYMPQAKFYKTLAELMEQWTNDVVWFQHAPTRIGPVTKLRQKNRREQLEIVALLKQDYSLLFSFTKEHYSFKKIQEILGIFCQMPANTRITFGGAYHATGARIIRDGCIAYYDANYPNNTTTVSNAQELFERILNFKYIAIDPYINCLNKSLVLEMELFSYFPGDMQEYTQAIQAKFKHTPLPTSAAQAQQWQDDSPCNFTLAHIAAFTRNPDLLRRVITSGYTDLTSKDAFGDTALEIAGKYNDRECMEVFGKFLKANPKISQELLCAALTKHNTNVVEFLISMGANIYILAKEFVNSSHFGLLYSQFNLNQIDGQGNTFMHYAVESSDCRKVGHLVRQGAAIDIRNNHGLTPLMLLKSVDYLSSELIKHLAPTINMQDPQGNTILHVCSDLAAIEMLLICGANLFIANNRGEKPISLLLQNGMAYHLLDLFRSDNLLDKAPADEIPVAYLFACIEKKNPLVFCYFLEKINPKLVDLEALLNKALHKKQYSICLHLLKQGADPNKKIDGYDYPIIHIIKHRMKPEFLELFLRYHADITLEDANGTSARSLIEASDDEGLQNVLNQFSSNSSLYL